MMELITANVYGHSAIVITVLLLLTIFFRLNQGDVMEYGLYTLTLWLLVEVIFIVRAEHFWLYIGHLTLAGILAYSAYLFFLFFVCQKFGRIYMGDGGLAALVPVTMFPLFIGLAIIIKVTMLLWGYLFGAG